VGVCTHSHAVIREEAFDRGDIDAGVRLRLEETGDGRPVRSRFAVYSLYSWMEKRLRADAKIIRELGKNRVWSVVDNLLDFGER
jgi:hypothetical protein